MGVRSTARRSETRQSLQGTGRGTPESAQGHVQHWQEDVDPLIGLALAHAEQASLDDLEARLLLDSRVVDLTRSYHLIFVMISFLKPLFFNGLKNERSFLNTMEGEDPGIQ
jgi:hypothetical protein